MWRRDMDSAHRPIPGFRWRWHRCLPDDPDSKTRARGGFTGRDLSAALGLAQTAAAVVLNDIAEHSREQLDAYFMDSVVGRVVIDQALGAIAAQRNRDIEEARVLLRSTAFAQNKTSRAVAEDVLTHRLTFPPENS